MKVRQATAHDAYALWLWANDSASRAASANRPPIGWDSHLVWLDDQIDRPDAVVLIAVDPDGRRPVGSIRFDTTDGWRHARLSYVVAPDARGEGRGGRLLELGMAWLLHRYPEVVVRADVGADNQASLSLFRRMAWQGTVADGGAWVFRWGGGS